MKPLTYEEIAAIEAEYVDNYRIPAGDAYNFARAIEAKVNAKWEAENKQLLEALKRLMRGTTTMQEAMDANQQARAAIAKYGEQK